MDQVGTVKINSIVMRKIRILIFVHPGRTKPNLSVLFIDLIDSGHHIIAWRHCVLNFARFDVDQKKMSVAVPFRDMDDLLVPC